MTQQHRALMMTDLQQSTACWDENQMDMLGLIKSYLRVVKQVTKSESGRIEGFLGDGHFLTFGNVDQAARAALRLRELWNERYYLLSPPEWEQRLAIKIAIHVGGVYRLAGGELVGSAINKVARILEAVPGGKILVSQEALEAFDERNGLAWGEFVPVLVRGFELSEIQTRVLQKPKGEQSKSSPTPPGPLRSPGMSAPGRTEIDALEGDLRAICGTAKEDSARAIDLARQIAQLEPNKVAASFRYIAMVAGRGDTDAFQQELEHYRKLVPDGDVSPALVIFARARMEEAEYSQAREYLAQAINLNHDVAAGLEPRAKAQHRAIRKRERCRIGPVRCDETLRNEMKDISRWRYLKREATEYEHLMGKVLVALGERTRAEEFFRRALAFGPEGDVIIDLAELLQVQSRWQEAESLLGRPACAESGNPRGLLLYAKCHDHRDALGEALKLYEATLEIYRMRAQHSEENAARWISQGRAGTAEMEQEEQAMHLAGAGECCQLMSRVSRRLKNRKLARELESNADEHVLQAACLYRTLALRQAERGRGKKAKALLAKATALRPDLASRPRSRQQGPRPRGRG